MSTSTSKEHFPKKKQLVLEALKPKKLEWIAKLEAAMTPDDETEFEERTKQAIRVTNEMLSAVELEAADCF